MTRFTAGSVAVLVVAICSHLVLAEEISPQTQKMIDRIVAGHKANQGKIKDFTMTCRFEMRREGAERPEFLKDFDYYQMGTKERLDMSQSRDDVHDPDPRGKKGSMANNGNRRLSHTADTQPGKVTPRSEALRNSFVLKDLSVLRSSNDWTDHVSEIQCKLKEWDPQKQSIRVDPAPGAPNLLQVHYESTRGGKSVYDWVFDASRGYEVVRASSKANWGHTDVPWHNTEATYTIAEVASGVWRTVGVKLTADSWTEDGKKCPRVTEIITNKTAAANTGSLSDRTFTFEGMGLPPGHEIIDYTVEPQIHYRLRSTGSSGHSEGSVVESSDAWTRYVQQFSTTYKLDDSQQQMAWAVLKELKNRAGEYRISHKPDYAAANKIEDRSQQERELRVLEGSIGQLFQELEDRLLGIPTEAQRKAAAAARSQAASTTSRPGAGEAQR